MDEKRRKIIDNMVCHEYSIPERVIDYIEKSAKKELANKIEKAFKESGKNCLSYREWGFIRTEELRPPSTFHENYPWT